MFVIKAKTVATCPANVTSNLLPISGQDFKPSWLMQ